jgi:hypothetical protein
MIDMPASFEAKDNSDLWVVFTHKLTLALDALEKAPSFAKSRYQTNVFRLATDLMDFEEGFQVLLEQAPRFEQAGLFYGGPWENPSKLLPSLVGSCLKSEGLNHSLEVLSELRIVAIATGQLEHVQMTQSEALAFLKTILALNLDLLFPDASEESRLRPKVFMRATRLFQLIQAEIPLDGLQFQLLQEIEFLLAQRPILTERVVTLITFVNKLPVGLVQSESSEKLKSYYQAITYPSHLSLSSQSDFARYLQLLEQANEDVLAQEIHSFKAVLENTGLGSSYHAVLLRYLVVKDPSLLSEALALDKIGAAFFEDNLDFVLELMLNAIFPETANAIYGFSQVLSRGLLSRSEVLNGLRLLTELEFSSEVKAQMLNQIEGDSGLSANAVLLAATLSVLGQPLGIGQGNNPTCQAARGISLWAQHAPGYLLQMITSAARNNKIAINFEGQTLDSEQLQGGVASGRIDVTLDPVSLLLVPHLDRLYDEMMKKAMLRGEDPHKWVNPAFYSWVPTGFMNVFDVVSNTIKDYPAFIRHFFATHHPDYNGEKPLVYPNPVGIFITDIHGNFLGLHAVSIQRIETDPVGELRVYFFNPNNDGRQKWGNRIETSVFGSGEIPGESSLPFVHFCARLYAFHYHPDEVGDISAVPETTVSELEKIAKASWGQVYTWS